MHILITNDDGITSRGIRALAQAALARGHEVLVSAPAGQCSANSHHITLSTPLMTRKFAWEGAVAHAVEGTPADCVRVAPNFTDKPIDFCLSGINDGENAATGVYYSGTVAAAREARMMYLPSMAVSIERGATEDMLNHLASFAVQLAEYLVTVELPRLMVVNLNAPALPKEQLKPLRLCPLSDAYFIDHYEGRTSPHGQSYYWMCKMPDEGSPYEQPLPGTDLALLQEGHMTCTFLGGYDHCNVDFAEKMQVFCQKTCISDLI